MATPPADAPTLPPPPHEDAGDQRTVGLAPVEAPGAAAPAKVAGYEILGELGRGGMGVVYKARQIALDRLVALKMVLTGGHADNADRERFQAEAEAVARLQHSNIVQVYEVGEREGQPFFSLELCEGGGLDRKLAGNPMPARAAAALVETLAGAVHYAHERGVVHRDLKPANVLLSCSRDAESSERSALAAALRSEDSASRLHEAVPKITDFGLAKRLDQDSARTRSGTIVGTPSYMAPEQAQGSKEIGPAADVYALGAILYECLTGRPPFKAATMLDTLHQVVGDEPVPPSRLQPGTPRDLETICLKCLQKEPGRRYAGAAALAEDLKRFLADEPIRARPVGPAERAVKWARRRPAVAALLAAVVAVTAVGIGLVLAQWQRAEGEWRRAEGERAAAETARGEAAARAEAEKTARGQADDARELAERALRAPAPGCISTTPPASATARAGLPEQAATLLERCPLDLRSWEWFRLHRLCAGEQVRCPGHQADIWNLAWSPDGRWLASGGSDASVTVRDAQTGVERVVLPHLSGVTGLAFSPDSRWIAAANLGVNYAMRRLGFSWEKAGWGEIRLWSTRDWKQVRTFPGRAAVAFSPDGSRIAGAVGRGIKVWETATGKEVLTLAGHTMSVTCLLFSKDGQRLISGAYDVDKVPEEAWASCGDIGVRGELKVWDLRTRKEAIALTAPAGGVSDLVLHPDGKRLVCATLNSRIEIHDLETGKKLHTLRGHTRRLEGVCFRPDGLLVSAGHDGRALVWDVGTGRQIGSRTGPTCRPCFSPDGSRLASFVNGLERSVRIYDGRLLEDALSLSGPKGFVMGLAFHPNGKQAAAVSLDRKLRLWDARTGRELYNVSCRGYRLAFTPNGKHLITDGEVPPLSFSAELAVRDAGTGKVLRYLSGHPNPVFAVVCSPDGKLLASSAYNPTRVNQPGDVRIWDLEKGKVVRTLPMKAAFFSLAWSPDGRALAGACLDKTVKLWDAGSGEVKRELRGHDTFVHSVAFHPKGGQIASGAADGSILLWDLDTGRQLHELRGHRLRIAALHYSPNGKRLASASASNTIGEVKVWDTETGVETCELPGWLAVAFSPDGERLAVGDGTADGQFLVRIHDATPAPPPSLAVLAGHTGSIRGLAATSDGTRFATAGDDGTVRVWTSATGEVLAVLQGHQGRVWQAAFHPDGKLLASAGSDGTVRLWDLPRSKEVRTLRGHKGDVRWVAFGPKGELASGGIDGKAIVWDVEGGQARRTFTHARGVFSLAFSPDGRHLATGAEMVRIWDLQTGETIRRIEESREPGDALVLGLAYRPDGKRLASTDRRVVHVWDAETGREQAKLQGHGADVYAIAWSGDGKHLASGGDDRLVRLWDAEQGRERAVWSGHPFWVGAVTFLHGETVASAGGEGKVRLWRRAGPR